MADREQPRSIRFPQSLWDAIDRDAVRCGRSAVKQMEVVLSVYYGLRGVDLDHNRLNLMRPETTGKKNGVLAAQIHLKEEGSSKGKRKSG